MTLRHCLQGVEKSGMIEYLLGGHKCARPASVQQGNSDDFFQISPDPENELVWKPSAVQVKHLKAANLASHFPFTLLDASPLVLVP